MKRCRESLLACAGQAHPISSSTFRRFGKILLGLTRSPPKLEGLPGRALSLYITSAAMLLGQQQALPGVVMAS